MGLNDLVYDVINTILIAILYILFAFIIGLVVYRMNSQKALPRCGKNGYKYLNKGVEDCCAVMPTDYDEASEMYTQCPMGYSMSDLPEGGCPPMTYTTYDNGTWGCCGTEPTEFYMIGKNCPN